ncbi:MAG: Rne/Rng family ribonuclease [Clostridia bacterium]|nr:Rne/Rng family ribonuclease [Clostridia bacterium]
MKELFIKKEDDIKKIYLIEDEKIIEKHEENTENPMLEGNIYVGKVQNVIAGMQAAFINIGSGKNAFIHLRDILPKKDITQDNDYVVEANDIREVLKPGDPILVQVTRDKNYKKGARVSKHISLTGRFFIYMPNSPFVAISKKIENEEKKKYLKQIILKNIPENSGGIIRTNAEKVSEEELVKDIKSLIEKWENIKNLDLDKFPKKIYDAGGIISKYLIDNIDKNLDRIVVCDKTVENLVQEFLDFEMKSIPIIVDNDYLKKFDFQNQLRKLENRKVWLKCGGFITIDKTEALTAIDVNTGKFIGKDDFENTIFIVNEEATVEIAKQLRARDIGGIIIIDYIDMHIGENKDRIIELMEQEIKKDSSKVQIEGFTKLNLLEMTRKHIYSF